MKSKKFLAGLSFSLLLSLAVFSTVFAEEGMWTFDNLPRKDLREKYGFEASEVWTDRLMKSSVRFSSGGSGSFISSNGLVLTNHHVAADVIEELSTPEKNLLETGFYAETLAQELKAPDLELDMLVSIQDVTARVNGAVKAGSSESEAFLQRRAEIARIEKESKDANGLKAQVVTLYQGGQFHLYNYKTYSDVRLVFAPEFAIAFFGGDPDNFEFPRYDLDMTILRAYENGVPAKTENFLPWSKSGAKADELVFVSGNPARTERILTVAALESLRDTRLPYVLNRLHRQERKLLAYAKLGAEHARQAQGMLFGVQNSRKARHHGLEGLRDEKIMNEKRKVEAATLAAVQADPKLAPLAQAWNRIAEARRKDLSIYPVYAQIEEGQAFTSVLFRFARTLVRIADEDLKPNADRLPEYRDSNRESLLRTLLSEAPIYPEFETYMFEDSLRAFKRLLRGNVRVVGTVFQGKLPEVAAREWVAGSKLKDPAERRKLLEGGKAAIEASQDPLILLARRIDADARAIRTRLENEVSAPEQEAYAQIAQVLFALYGTSVYPDATFTPRLAYGKVKGYSEPNGTLVAPFTTIGGAFEYETLKGAQDPYLLPASWHRAKSRLDLTLPFNFVSTNDIIGGNSGSPVVNRNGELVGLIFDGNIHSLVGNYIFDETRNRAVSVHSSAILEALKKVYGAQNLVDQIGR